MNIVIDSILSQIGGAQRAARWEKLLRKLAAEILSKGWKIYGLDRGGAPTIEGTVTFPFPNYRFSEGVSDSQLLQKICDFVSADVFVSSACTMPLDVPTLQILISGSSGMPKSNELLVRPDVEKRLALAFSSVTICDSDATGRSLLKLSAVGERGCPVISPIAWDTIGEPEGLVHFAQTVVNEIGVVHELALTDSDQKFRAKWRRLREIQASVDVAI
jgi:hypothetical protein